MAAASIRRSARVRVRNLTQRVVDLDVVRAMSRVSERLHVFSGELVGSNDCFEVPIGPVEVIVEDRQREDVRNLRA